MSQAYHLKYRPRELADVIGQDAVVASLKKTLKEGKVQAFLFTGPGGTPGIGKTTLARLIAAEYGCSDDNGGILEIDAATFTGIDAMREVQEGLRYRGLVSLKKTVIIDEAHALSKQAWQSLLKSVEEPPEHVIWVFCTTEATKIPETIRSRCACFVLKPVRTNDIYDLLVYVTKQEKLKLTEDELYKVAEKAMGSPRRALVSLAQFDPNLEAIKDEEGENITALARDILDGRLTWQRAMVHLDKMKMLTPEEIRLKLMAYISAVLRNIKEEKKAANLVNVLSAFTKMYYPAEGYAPLLVSIGYILYS
jgi:DNA polymerase III subunit gamma/tau